MNSDKLLVLLRNIRNLRYLIEQLRNAQAFETALAGDLGLDPREAMALLGYLLEHDYVRLNPEVGLIINPTNPEMQKLLTSQALDQI